MEGLIVTGLVKIVRKLKEEYVNSETQSLPLSLTVDMAGDHTIGKNSDRITQQWYSC